MRYTAAHWGAYQIEDATLRPLPDDPAPSRIGRGWQSAASDPQSRILRPAIRKGWLAGDGGSRRGEDTFVEVSWDRAIAAVATELDRVRGTHGNRSIFAGSYGWASAGRFHHAQSQMRRFLNLIGGFVGARDTYSHAAAEVLFPLITGLSNGQVQNQMTAWPLIAEHARLVVAFGGISGRTAQVTSSGTSHHEVDGWLSRMNARKINISPQRSDLDDAEWLAIRPGTDTAMILALCHTLLEDGLQDETFLARCTSGWPQFRAYLDGTSDGVAKSADWAAPICDIGAGTIGQLARDMAATDTLVALPWGIQRADHGEQPIWAGLALAAMLGQIGRPGLGFAFGLGSMTSVGRVSDHMAWPSVPQGRNRVNDYIPVARITEMLECPGTPYTYNCETRTYPDIRLVYWVGGNPFHHHQDLRRLDAAWRKPECVIVHDHAWTATARRADFVLPATAPLEREDIMMARADPRLIYMSALQPPMGEALDDHEIFRRLSAAMGHEAAFTEGRGPEDWLRWLWAEAVKRTARADISLPDFEAFRDMGRIDLPQREPPRVLFGDFVADPDANPLPSESGKITLFNRAIDTATLPDCPGHPAWLAPFESLLDAPDGALHLISGQPATRLHAQNDRGAEAQADKIDGREACYMHPDTAAARGIAAGKVVRLWNGRGACLAGVRLCDTIRPDCVALATGAWFDPAVIDGEWLELAGNPNALTHDKGCSGLSQGNSAHTTLVFAEPWTKPLPPLSIDRPPRFSAPD